MTPLLLALAVVLAGTLAGTPVQATETDLLPVLRRADVCDDAGCRRPDADEATALALTPGAGRDLYVRVPAAAELVLELKPTPATLAVALATEGVPARPLASHRDGTTVRVPLDDAAGQIARLSLRVAPAPGAAAVSIRSAQIRTPDAPTASPPTSPASTGRRPNVVLYVVDTLRADHLGCHGYSRPTSPRIDAFAAGAVRFRAAMAQSSWTLPATASLLTGRTPPGHGAVSPQHAIRPDVATLAETLGAAGWDTAAFVTNYLGAAAYGHARGFATFRFYREQGARRPGVYLRSDVLQRRIDRWLATQRARRPDVPFFLYVHASDPHFPYVPARRHARPFVDRHVRAGDVTRVTDAVRALHNGQQDWGTRPVTLAASDLALLRDLYDGDVHQADESFGRLLDALAAQDMLDDTVIVFTSDHGEEFLEHGGLAHGQTLHREALHVPLVMRRPGGAGAVVDDVAQHVDVYPTVLAAVGLPIPGGLDGRSLLVPAPPGMPIEGHAALRLGPFEQDAIVTADWKVVRDLVAPPARRFTLFDLRADPAERADVGAARPILLGYGSSRVRTATAPRPPGPLVPDAQVERLRALGYLVD